MVRAPPHPITPKIKEGLTTGGILASGEISENEKMFARR